MCSTAKLKLRGCIEGEKITEQKALPGLCKNGKRKESANYAHTSVKQHMHLCLSRHTVCIVKKRRKAEGANASVDAGTRGGKKGGMQSWVGLAIGSLFLTFFYSAIFFFFFCCVFLWQRLASRTGGVVGKG